jgi:tetratricopeptide (TPR) repeat protein
MNRTNIEKKQVDLIRESICVFTKCMECRDLFKEGILCFSNIEEFVDDKGGSCLFRLKEMCHDLFRRSDEASYKEKLYDITVGYIFHEAMKLRENLYQIEYYKPKHDIGSHELTALENKIVHEIGALIQKAEKRAQEGLREIKPLLMELIEQLKGLIRLYKNNYLIPRFIFENEKILMKVFGRKGFEGLLNDMYRDGRVLLMFKAAQSYLESEYYELARNLFRRVASLDSKNKLALFLFMYTSAHHFYFRNRFSKARNYAQKALSMSRDQSMESYGKVLEKLVLELSGDWKELKKV